MALKLWKGGGGGAGGVGVCVKDENAKIIGS